MKLTEILLVALIGSSTSLASHAKEVELVKFGSPRPLSKNALPIDLAGAADLSETIAKSLRIQFEAFPSRWSLATDLPFVREQVNRQARIDQPTVIMQFRQASCDGVDYVPTWWLPRAAERRRAQYFGVMADIACEHGLPTSLLDAVIAQESGFKSWAVSSAGAVGLMQIMPRTGRMLGLTAPYDPVANMRAGARYLRQQFDRFDRVDLALAAYNAGPERRALKRSQIPPFRKPSITFAQS